MKTRFFILVSISFFLSGCFAPLNLSYDSAKNLDKGQLEIQGAYSSYFAPNDSLPSTLINTNWGFSLGYDGFLSFGIGANINLNTAKKSEPGE